MFHVKLPPVLKTKSRMFHVKHPAPGTAR